MSERNGVYRGTLSEVQLSRKENNFVMSESGFRKEETMSD